MHVNAAFIQLSGAWSFTQQQWTVSSGETPHKKLFVQWMFGITDGKSQNCFFLHQRHIKFHKTTQKYITTTQGVSEAREISCLLPRKHKLWHATMHWNPETIPPSQEPAIKSTQVHHATEIKARVQMAPIRFPFLLSNHQFCSLLQKHLPCCPIWIFFISEILQIKVVCRYKAQIQSYVNECPCLYRIKLTDTPWGKQSTTCAPEKRQSLHPYQ